MGEQAISAQEIANREHIAPNKTGDNIAAKRVVNYDWDGANWQRTPLSYVPYAYDYVAITYNATTDIYAFYQGGNGGTLATTVTLTYQDSTKQQLNSVART